MKINHIKTDYNDLINTENIAVGLAQIPHTTHTYIHDIPIPNLLKDSLFKNKLT